MAKKENFNSIESLNTVIRVVNEADEALQDKSRLIQDSPISEVLAGAGGVVAGGAISFVALVNLGVTGLSAAGITSGLATAGTVIGGGMVAGIAVLAAPAIILGGTAVLVTSVNKQRKLKQKKSEVLKTATEKYDAIVRALKDEVDISREREEYLNSLNILLRSAIKELKDDLGKGD